MIRGCLTAIAASPARGLIGLLRTGTLKDHDLRLEY